MGADVEVDVKVTASKVPQREEQDDSQSYRDSNSLTEPASSADLDAEHVALDRQPSWRPDYTFKVLLVGDSGVGKTCLVMRYTANRFEEKINSTVGVDFAVKRLRLHDVNVKVTIWDTAGQERFRTLSSTFYRGAKGIIFVYDVTRPETLASLQESWMAELACYQPHPDVAKMVMANKVDQSSERLVSWADGVAFAAQHNCLFCETSAKENVAVSVAFHELLLRILETPTLLEDNEEEGVAINLNPEGATSGKFSVSCAC